MSCELPLTSVQIWDYISSELVHNITYAHRLPPTFIEQARGLANLRENAIFSDASMDGIGNSKSTSSIALVSVSLISSRSRQSHCSQLRHFSSPAHRFQRRPSSAHAYPDHLPAFHLALRSDRGCEALPRVGRHP